MALFLQVLKETGARRGEAFNLKWTDIDLTTGTIRITPEKGSNPRAFALSPKLLKMLATQPHEHEGRIWQYRSITNLERTFRKQRKRTAFKLQNPKLLQIHFHILRHWKATTEYAKTKDLLYVQKLLTGVSEAYISFKGDTFYEIEYDTQPVFLFAFLQGYAKIYQRRDISFF